MHDEGHDASGENIILHVGIPSRPHAFCDIEVHIVLRYLVELAPVGIGRWREEGRGRVPVATRLDLRLQKLDTSLHLYVAAAQDLNLAA